MDYITMEISQGLCNYVENMEIDYVSLDTGNR